MVLDIDCESLWIVQLEMLSWYMVLSFMELDLNYKFELTV